MTMNTQFEHDLFDFYQNISKLYDDHPNNVIFKSLYFKTGNLCDSYERQKDKENAEIQQKVKELLKAILKCLIEDK